MAWCILWINGLFGIFAEVEGLEREGSER